MASTSPLPTSRPLIQLCRWRAFFLWLCLSTSSLQALAVALPITVLPASRSRIVCPPGATINLTVNFDAASPVADDYTLVLYLVDKAGKNVVTMPNNLNNNLLGLPTSLWSGPVAFTLAVPLPSLPDGAYTVMLGLSGWAGLMPLSAGPGVAQDARFRYTVATVQVNSTAHAPDLLPPATLDLTGYKLTFDDEFTAMSISDSQTNDGSRWYTQNEQCCMQTSDGSGTAMAPRRSPSNPFSLLRGGGLNIRLQKVNNAWTSGVLTSVDNTGVGFSQQYGYFEMKARFPAGENTWPAFWLLNTSAKSRAAPPGEIDIVEYVANPGFANYISTTLHDWGPRKDKGMSHYRVSLPSDGFHTYGMMWTEKTMTFFFDGAVMLRTPTPAVMKQPYYLLLDLGIGAGWPTEKTPPIDDMQIQYVRVYSR
jgi:beta-glucanase (GH16 family)